MSKKILDPQYMMLLTQVKCADFSQGNTKKFRHNAGKQCVAMSLTAIICNEITIFYIYILKYSNFHSRIKNSTHHCQKGLLITQYLLPNIFTMPPWHSTRSPTSPFFCPTFFTAAILLASGFGFTSFCLWRF